MKRGLGMFIGIATGLTAATLANAALYQPFDVVWPPNLTGFWGMLYGSFSGVIAFGIALWLLSANHSRIAKAGKIIAAVTLAVFGLGVVLWLASWGVPPFTLEGAWMYPLAVIPLIASGLLVRSLRPKIEAKDREARWSSDLYR